MKNNILQYKDYEARVDFDLDARVFHGVVLGTRDVVTFQADSFASVEQEFHISVDDYLEFCRESGDEPDKSYSGHIAFRTKPEVHRCIAMAVAKEAACSLSKWIERACENELERLAAPESVSLLPDLCLGHSTE